MERTMSTENPRIECVIPILHVRDLSVALNFYIETLGFTRDWGGDREGSIIASVSRDGRAIMLCSHGQGRPGAWVWIGVEDVVPLYEALKSRGAKIVLPLTNYSFAYEMRVEDPDGNVLR